MTYKYRVEAEIDSDISLDHLTDDQAMWELNDLLPLGVKVVGLMATPINDPVFDLADDIKTALQDAGIDAWVAPLTDSEGSFVVDIAQPADGFYPDDTVDVDEPDDEFETYLQAQDSLVPEWDY